MIKKLLFLVLVYFYGSAATLNVPSQYPTVQAALNAVQPGDTISLAPGTYAEEAYTKTDGTAAQTITIDGVNAENTVIKMFVLRNDYYVIKNLTFKGTHSMYLGQFVFDLGANFNVLKDCVVDCEFFPKVYGIRWEATPGFVFKEASDNIVEKTEIKNVQGYPMFSMGGTRNTLRNCFIHEGFAVDFMRLTGASNHVCDNYFLHNRAASGNHPDFVQTFGNNGEQSYGHIIERNIVDGVENGQLFQFSATGQENIRDWIFRNNIFMNAALAGGGNVPGIKFYNNVFYRIGSAISFSWRTFGFNTGITGGFPIYSEMTQPTPSGSLIAEGDGGIYRYGGYYQVRTAQLQTYNTLIPGREYEARTRNSGLIWYNGHSYSNQERFFAVEGVPNWTETADNQADLEPTQLYVYCQLVYKGKTYRRDDWFQVDPSDRTWTSNYPDAVAPWRVVIDFAHRAEMKNNIFIDCGPPGAWQAFYSFDLLLKGVSADYNYVGKDGFQPVRSRFAGADYTFAVGDPRGWGGKGFWEPHGINGGDPFFRNIDNLDFYPLKNSFLINAGIPVEAVTEDFLRTARPVGENYDIGPFEFTEGSGRASPKNLVIRN